MYTYILSFVAPQNAHELQLLVKLIKQHGFFCVDFLYVYVIIKIISITRYFVCLVCSCLHVLLHILICMHVCWRSLQVFCMFVLLDVISNVDGVSGHTAKLTTLAATPTSQTSEGRKTTKSDRKGSASKKTGLHPMPCLIRRLIVHYFVGGGVFSYEFVENILISLYRLFSAMCDILH